MRPYKFRSGFTLLEIMIASVIIITVIAVLMLSSGSRDSFAADRVEQLQAYAQLKRISIFLARELKSCAQILVPEPLAVADRLVCQRKDGYLNEYLLDTSGNFLSRVIPAEQPNLPAVARRVSPKVITDSFEFRQAPGGAIELLVKYSILDEGRPRPLLEFFDAFTTGR